MLAYDERLGVPGVSAADRTRCGREEG